jgi:hypothetical protein
MQLMLVAPPTVAVAVATDDEDSMMKSSNTPNSTHIALNERPRDPSKSIKNQREEKKGRNTKTNNNKRHTPKALDASAVAALKATQYQCLSAYLLRLNMAVESVIGFNALRVQ